MKQIKGAAKGRRYTEAEKAKVFEFIDEVNAKKKRGGQRHAAKKFGISLLTISNWLKNRKGYTASTKRLEVLEELASLAATLESKERELALLKTKFRTLLDQHWWK
jgi:hypothetical protein